MDGVEDFDTSCWGLMPVRVATVGGPRPRRPERRGARRRAPTSASSPDHLERYRVGALGRAGQADYQVAANWKAIAENYSECLHCPGVHPELNALSHYMSGEVMEGAGAWCGGSMTLTEGASTMGREGGHAQHAPADRRPLGRGPDARSSTSCCSRTRSSPCIPTTRCSTRCGRARSTAPTWSASGSSSRRRSPPRASTPRTRSTSGTRSTARTGTSAS